MSAANWLALLAAPPATILLLTVRQAISAGNRGAADDAVGPADAIPPAGVREWICGIEAIGLVKDAGAPRFCVRSGPSRDRAWEAGLGTSRNGFGGNLSFGTALDQP